jgi:anaerobic selenocysteine-containing dehydrogenase
MNCCPTLVQIGDGRVQHVSGDPENEVFAGYTCLKGRAEPERHAHPDRLLTSLKRAEDGTHRPISPAQAMDEIAARIGEIVDRYGPRAVASYSGNAAGSDALMGTSLGAFISSLGSNMQFSPNTIDKPGKSLALAMHGKWMAPLMGYQRPDVAVLIGANPYKSYYGAAAGHPGKWLKEQLDRGMQLVVVDPRRSDVAKRAHIHLQPRPGTDPEILASLLHVVIDEGLYDREFVQQNANGFDQLAAAVAPFTPDVVGADADVPAEDIRSIARLYAAADRGYVACGVGPGFAKSSTLLEYLTLALETLSGHWMRAGESVERMPTLMPAGPYRAQAADPTPAYGLGEGLRVRDLTLTTAGLSTGGLSDEILLPGEGQVRALLSMGGNPMTAWPDQIKTIAALESLDLLVQIDPWMSATARLADYVIAPPMFYEKPGITMTTDFMIQMPTYYGPAVAYAQYTPAIVPVPPGSDLIPEWEFIYGLAQRLDLELEVGGLLLSEKVSSEGSVSRSSLDMTEMPTADELLTRMAAHGRVSLDEIKRSPSGAAFPEPQRIVGEKEPGWKGRFDLANPDMMRDLAGEHPATHPWVESRQFPFRMIAIRNAHMFNSTLNDASTNRGRFYNPAYMHPSDIEELGLSDGDPVLVRSARATIRSVVHGDADLRRGLVAMAHGYGGLPEEDDLRFREMGSPPARLLESETLADPYVGMPRIGDVPVSVTRR